MVIMSHVAHMVSHSATEGMEKGFEEESCSGDLRRGYMNAGLSRSHKE